MFDTSPGDSRGGRKAFGGGWDGRGWGEEASSGTGGCSSGVEAGKVATLSLGSGGIAVTA